MPACTYDSNSDSSQTVSTGQLVLFQNLIARCTAIGGFSAIAGVLSGVVSRSQTRESGYARLVRSGVGRVSLSLIRISSLLA